jgi:Flp pilus assembly protein TadG
MIDCAQPLAKLHRRFSAAAGGNVTVIFSLLLMVLMGIGGAAIDYVRLVEQRTVFAAAADSAVLAAISSAREAERNGLTGIPKLAKAAAQNAWDANVATASIETSKAPKITVSNAGSAWTATIRYDEASPTSFMALLGVKTMRLAGEAKASTKIEKNPNYWDFHIVIDDSSSMGIGATQADMDALQAHPEIGCTFACHWANYSIGETDSVSKAKKAGIKLRIDIVDDAVDAMIAELTKTSGGDNIRSKLWGMNDTAVELVALTAKLNDIKNHDIQLYKTPVSKGNTNYPKTLEKIESEVGKAGDGKSSLTPKKAVFIVTDGIHETYYKESNSVVDWHDHYTGPMDPEFCKTMKDNKVLVGVLYIDYIVPPGYDFAIDPFKDDILPTLQACATEGLFFNATTPKDITNAMKDMLSATMGMGAVRLTN